MFAAGNDRHRASPAIARRPIRFPATIINSPMRGSPPRRRLFATRSSSGVSPRRVLEVGSYEGASACYLIDRLAVRHELELHCVDHWRGGIEHQSGGSAQTDRR